MLRLRPYKDCDAASIVTWIKDEYQFRQWCADRYEHYPITAGDVIKYYTAYNDAPTMFQMTACNGVEIVGHLIMRLNVELNTLRFGFVIVDAEKRGKGYGKEMLILALKYAFGILKVDKVTLGVFENNNAAISCYKSVGFIETGKVVSYKIMEKDWPCLEMSFDRESFKDRCMNSVL